MTTGAMARPRNALRPGGGLLRCPNCEQVRPEWQFTRLHRASRYEALTVELFKCPRCRHVFGPMPEGALQGTACGSPERGATLQTE